MAFVAGHLYVGWAGIVTGPSSTPIYRYPIHNGIPVTKPDLQYPSMGVPFTVRSNRSLIGISDFGIATVFYPNSTNVERSLNLPEPYFLTIYTGLTADGPGHIFASYQEIYGAKRKEGSAPDERCVPDYAPQDGVFVFGRHARGYALPVQCFPVDAYNYNNLYLYEGIALDAQGSLYVPVYTGTTTSNVVVYGTPIKNPQIIRTLSGASLQNSTSVALDGNDHLWVLNANSAGYSYVGNYRKYADGDVIPGETVAVAYPSMQHWYGNIKQSTTRLCTSAATNRS